MTPTPFSLDGRVALVTGGNSGIGRTLALALREAGAKVAIGGRRAARNALVLADLGGDGDQAMALELDVCDEASVERAVNAVVERFGRIDILINNAGGVNRKSVMELDRRDWDRVIAINLTGPFLCTKHAARRALAQGADTLIHDAQFIQSDYKPTWGHSTIASAIDVAARAGVKRLILYHHDPDRSDDALDHIGREAQHTARERSPGLEVLVAREGLELEV